MMRSAASAIAANPAPHESEFLLNMVEEPVVRFEALLGHLSPGSRLEMHFQVDVLFQPCLRRATRLDRAAPLPAGIGKSFCDRALGKIKQVGNRAPRSRRKDSEISDAIIEKWSHFGRDIDRVASCFIGRNLS